MVLLLVPLVLTLICLLVWVLYRLEAGLPQAPDTHQHYLNDYILTERENRP